MTSDDPCLTPLRRLRTLGKGAHQPSPGASSPDHTSSDPPLSTVLCIACPQLSTALCIASPHTPLPPESGASDYLPSPTPAVQSPDPTSPAKPMPSLPLLFCYLPPKGLCFYQNVFLLLVRHHFPKTSPTTYISFLIGFTHFHGFILCLFILLGCGLVHGQCVSYLHSKSGACLYILHSKVGRA